MLKSIIDRYILKTVFPYFLFAACFLTSVLLLQQASRLSSIYPTALLTTSNIMMLINALLPKTLAFTFPMSALIGTLLGISKLRAESEIAVMQSAGVSNTRLISPILLFSSLICLVCLSINLYISPNSLKSVREKLKNISSVEIASAFNTGAFNTEIPKMCIYIKEGNSDSAEWKGLFITKDEGNTERVITATSGNIDFDGNKVELVLKDVTSVRYAHDLSSFETKPLITERLRFLRLEVSDNIMKKRASLDSDEKKDFEEMTNTEILHSSSENTAYLTEGYIQIQRRLALSFAPLILALAGFWSGMLLNRSSKVLGLIVSLVLLVAYYALFLVGEQMTRAGLLSLYVAGWLANLLFILSLLTGSLFSLVVKRVRKFSVYTAANKESSKLSAADVKAKVSKRVRHEVKDNSKNSASNRLMGYMDINIVSRMSLFFTISFLTVISVFVVFTFFDIWKSIFTNKIPLVIVLKYLFFLLPLVTVQVIGPCALIASFVTFLLMANRNEVIIWLSSGTSIYRQLTTMIIIGASLVSVHWVVQEYAMPSANILQDSLRSQIKTGYPKTLASSGKQWLAVNGLIFNYEFDSTKKVLRNPKVYTLNEFDQISSILISPEGIWDADRGMIMTKSIQIRVAGNQTVTRSPETVLGKDLQPNYFSTFLTKPFYLKTAELKEQINILRNKGEDVTQLQVAFYRRYSEPFISIISVIIGSCIALLFRKGNTLIQIISMIISGFVTLAVIQFSISAGVSLGFPVFLACLLPYLLLCGIGLYLVAMIKT